mgnify:CR=1 FL=1
MKELTALEKLFYRLKELTDNVVVAKSKTSFRVFDVQLVLPFVDELNAMAQKVHPSWTAFPQKDKSTGIIKSIFVGYAKSNKATKDNLTDMKLTPDE